MEIDGELEVVRIAVVTSAFLDGSNLRVQSFCNSVGDPMGKVALNGCEGGFFEASTSGVR